MAGAGEPRLAVLIAAAGVAWEADALRLLDTEPDLVLSQRNVDVPDLLASAATGLARCAVVAESLPGLDGDAVARLRRAEVGVVVVLGPGADAAARDRLARLGVAGSVGSDLAGLADAVRRAAADRAAPEAGPVGSPGTGASAAGTRKGRLVAVWGPAGAPGRTTVATSLAAEAASRSRSVLLVDADPYGGAVAQHLGILDEVSGLLAAARRANSGRLEDAGLSEVARTVDGGLRVLTGLPRPDRWSEVRPAAFGAMLDAAERLADDVVVDTGFSLEDDGRDAFEVAPRRNETTLATLERATEVVVVGTADPVGLSRLARGLVDLRDLLPDAALHVVVNRTRPTLGWSRTDVGEMIETFVRPARIHYLPEDRPAVDRALCAGRSLHESGDSPLRRGVVEVADALWDAPPTGRTRPRPWRRRAQEPNSR